MILSLSGFILTFFLTSCGHKGCTDPSATNYDPDATRDDGSCVYGDYQYAQVTFYRDDECFDGNLDLYLDGAFQKSFSANYGGTTAPSCGKNDYRTLTFELLLGEYHIKAYADSTQEWDFYINLKSENECYLVALKCGGYAEGDCVEFPDGTGSLTVWSSFDFSDEIRVKVDGYYKGRIRYYYTGVPSCGSSGCVTISNLDPGTYTISAENGTYSWNNYTVLVREGWCNSFELK